jgi:hypothetical protein
MRVPRAAYPFSNKFNLESEVIDLGSHLAGVKYKTSLILHKSKLTIQLGAEVINE